MTNDRRRRRGRRRRGRRKRGNWFTRMAVWKKVLLCFALVLLCVIGVAGFYVIAKWDKVETEEIKTEDLVINQEVKENLDLGTGYTNIALFGVDTREGDLGEGTRTDCIIVASLNNETKEIRMVSVYRDTLLDLSEGTYQKCNAAYSYGGPTQAINMLNMNLDLNIEDYVTVDFGAIADAIDLLGGLEIDVTDEEAMYMNEHIEGTGLEAGKEVHFMEHGGLQLLDGVQATTYARIRSTAGGDFTRTERQRLVIQKIFEKAIQTDLGTLNKIIDQVFPQIRTSFTLAEILNYAKAYKDYVLGDNMGFPYEDALTMDSLPEVGSAVIPDSLVDNVIRLHAFLFGTENYSPSSTVYEISNNIAYKASIGGGTVDTTDESSITGEVQNYNNEYYNPNTEQDVPGDNNGYYGNNEGSGDGGEYYDPNAGTGEGEDPSAGY